MIIMLNFNSLFLFIFIFTCLITIRASIKLISLILQPNPDKVSLSKIELTIIGLSISYILTYLLK